MVDLKPRQSRFWRDLGLCHGRECRFLGELLCLYSAKISTELASEFDGTLSENLPWPRILFEEKTARTFLRQSNMCCVGSVEFLLFGIYHTKKLPHDEITRMIRLSKMKFSV